MSKYQLFEPLSLEEYNSLKHSISIYGVRVPVVICGETGEIIDGHHRLQICEELGIKDYSVEKIYGLTEQEKKQMARSLNMARRHITTEQKHKQIQDHLRENFNQSDRSIASMLGVSDKTVGTQRKEMERRAEIPHVEKKIDSLGRKQSRKPVSVFNPTEKEERILEPIDTN